MPMLIGHSQGGMLAIRVLLRAGRRIPRRDSGVESADRAIEPRTTIVDPLTGAGAPGRSASRFRMSPRWRPASCCRASARTVADARQAARDSRHGRGLHRLLDRLGSDRRDLRPGSERYHADRHRAGAQRRCSPAGTSHIGMPHTRASRAQSGRRARGSTATDPRVAAARAAGRAGIDASNIVHAADIWYSVKKHWCLEAQRLIGARRAAIAQKGGAG